MGNGNLFADADIMNPVPWTCFFTAQGHAFMARTGMKTSACHEPRLYQYAHWMMPNGCFVVLPNTR
jgi:hypothetical protein